MRLVHEDPELVARRVANAKRSLGANHSLEARGRQLERLLQGVTPRPRPQAVEPATAPLRLRDRVVTLVRRLGRIDALVAAVDALAGRIEGLERRLDWMHRAAIERIDELDRDLQALRAQVEGPPYISDSSALRVVAEDGAERLGFDAADGPLASFYEQFEELFRGPEQLIRQRLSVYVPVLTGHAPVVDLGCGRGEMLDLLAEAGIAAWGVELNADVAQTPLRKGHRVEIADACTVVAALPADSVGAVFSSQFAEHLSSEDLAGLVAAARRALQPGGLFIVETVNPHSIGALRTFWLDPSHVHPIFPEALLVLCRSAGFARGHVIYPNGTGAEEVDRTTSGEYAVIAQI
jgi:SAM-dependent methyltransferase